MFFVGALFAGNSKGYAAYAQAVGSPHTLYARINRRRAGADHGEPLYAGHCDWPSAGMGCGGYARAWASSGFAEKRGVGRMCAVALSISFSASTRWNQMVSSSLKPCAFERLLHGGEGTPRRRACRSTLAAISPSGWRARQSQQVGIRDFGRGHGHRHPDLVRRDLHGGEPAGRRQLVAIATAILLRVAATEPVIMSTSSLSGCGTSLRGSARSSTSGFEADASELNFLAHSLCDVDGAASHGLTSVSVCSGSRIQVVLVRLGGSPADFGSLALTYQITRSRLYIESGYALGSCGAMSQMRPSHSSSSAPSTSSAASGGAAKRTQIWLSLVAPGRQRRESM